MSKFDSIESSGSVTLFWDNILTDRVLDKDLIDKCVDLVRRCIKKAVNEYENSFADGALFELNVMLVDNDLIRQINNEQRDIDKATDVLSFPMNNLIRGLLCDDAEQLVINPETQRIMLGDIVISLEKCDEQANEYGHSFEREFLFLLSHGAFHVLGFDHMTAEDEKEMIGLQEEILCEMGYSRKNK